MLDIPDYTKDIPKDRPYNWVPGPLGRAEVRVYRPDGVLRGHRVSDWEVFRADAKEIISIATVVGERESIALTFNDTDGSGRTFRALTDNEPTYNRFGDTPNITLAWGSNDGSAAAADTDFQLDTQKDSFVSNSVTASLADNEVTATGAKQWTGANTTLREAGYIRELRDSLGTKRNILMDRAVVADTTVNTNDTVTITYEWTWTDA